MGCLMRLDGHKNFDFYIDTVALKMLRISEKRFLSRTLHHEGTTLNRVHEDVATWQEGIVAPAADKFKTASLRLAIILRVDVKETNLLDLLASGVLG